MGSWNDHDRADDFAAVAELAEAFTALVTALHEGEPATFTVDEIVKTAATCMPRSQHAALIIAEHGTTRSIADDGGLGQAVDRIRADTGEGPALDVIEVNDLVVSGDLSSDPRWPRFGPRVTAVTGIRSIATFRLYVSPAHRAALSFHSDWPYAFDELATATGAIFAAYCSLALSHDLLLDEPVRPRRAADVHREIGVAIGILMTTAGHTTQTAYRALHGASRRLQRSLPDLAAHVVVHRQLPDSRRAGE